MQRCQRRRSDFGVDRNEYREILTCHRQAATGTGAKRRTCLTARFWTGGCLGLNRSYRLFAYIIRSRKNIGTGLTQENHYVQNECKANELPQHASSQLVRDLSSIACRSSGIGIGLKKYTSAPPVLPFG